MSHNPIYPLAYELIPGQTCKLYDVSFPQRWKEELIKIIRLDNPKFNFQYKLPTVSLEKLLNSWMDEIVSLKPLSAASDDRQWLSSCMAFTDKRLQRLYEIIRVWITGTYINEGRSPVVRDSAKRFCDTMRVSELYGLTSERTVTLSNADGTVNGDAFDALPLLAINHLQGKELELDGHTIHLCYAVAAGKENRKENELVSLPIEDPKTRQSFSYVFRFSVQTTPPGRFALLLCDMSVRRWVRDLKKSVIRSDNGVDVCSRNDINAHIYLKQSDKYCKIPIEFPYENGQAKEPRWRWQDQECYNLYGYEALPDMRNLWEAVEHGSKIYLLPYKNGMWSFQQSEIGIGVSIKEKERFYHEILNLLDGMVRESGAAYRKRGEYPNNRYKTPREYETAEKFREWVSRCAETDRITFELYGMSNSPKEAAVLDALCEQLKQDFGENAPKSCLRVEIVSCESGVMASKLRNRTIQEKLNKSDSIQRELSAAKDVTACLFVLPGADDFMDGDPKDSIRHGFALTGRVTQFIQPKSEEEEEITFKSRIKNAVYDLYRQIGVTAFVNTDQLEKKARKLLADTPCVGMYIFT